LQPVPSQTRGLPELAASSAPPATRPKIKKAAAIVQIPERRSPRLNVLNPLQTPTSPTITKAPRKGSKLPCMKAASHFFPFGLRLGAGGALPVASVARMAVSKSSGANDTLSPSVPSVFFFPLAAFRRFWLKTGIFTLYASLLGDILAYQNDLSY
jgi:hypothetical protein